VRVDWTASPGPSPEGAWRDLAPKFAARHTGYEEIGMAPTTFLGVPAATWEYRYHDGGADLHAVDLGFVTDRYGFAINYQSHEKDWQSMQATFDRFKQSFRPR
jgi:hypothetical protein